MKKCFFLFLILFANVCIAQNEGLTLRLGDYKDGDTINSKKIAEGLAFKFIGKDAEKYGFRKWEITVYLNNKTVVTSRSLASQAHSTVPDIKLAPEICKLSDKMVRIEIQKIAITFPGWDDLKNEPYFSHTSSTATEEESTAFTFYVSKKAAAKPEIKNDVVITPTIAPSKVNPEVKLIDYNGKLMMGKEKNKPVVNQKIILEDKVTKESQSTFTNNYGDFTFKNINANDSAEMKVDGQSFNVLDGVLYMARADGSIIRSFNKANNVFYFDFIPPELITMQKVKEEDTELKINNFTSSGQKEITIVESIYYLPNAADIVPASYPALDKIVNAMQKNTALKLAIASHTDAKGDDAYNMTLSEKRAKIVLEYFISKGISKDRMTAKGYGETMIKNRCKNGVDCSEAEHEVNRRTEFKFTK